MDQHHFDALVGVPGRRLDHPARRVVPRPVSIAPPHQTRAAHEPARQSGRDVGEPAPQRYPRARRPDLFERSRGRRGSKVMRQFSSERSRAIQKAQHTVCAQVSVSFAPRQIRSHEPSGLGDGSKLR